MATYPRFSTLADSSCTPNGGQEASRATNGTLRLRRYWPTTKREFDVRHVLTDAERATLQTFYEAERDANVSYVSPWDGVTYTVRFVAAPVYQRRGRYHEARVLLAEA